MKSAPLFLSQLDIPVSEIYRTMGFNGSEPDNVSRETTEQLLREASEWVHPRYEYLILDGEYADGTVTVNGVDLEVGKIIGGQLRDSERFVLFTASVSDGWTRWMEMLEKRDDILQKFIADCIGSQIVESTADYMEQVLQEELYLQGLKRTNRFSPGYCGWTVAQQPLLFSLFPEEHPCGITLTESCLMMPVKSVSGIIGVGHRVNRMPYTCNICTMEMCIRRKRIASAH